MDRREFLIGAALAPLAVALPGITRAAADASRGPRFLILVELNGGNDGLNAIVPYADPRYYELRPQLAIPRDQVIPLNAEVGFNPSLSGLMPAFEAGELAVVQGLGYADFNRSHFRSIDIWDTGSGAQTVSNEGWLTRAYDAPAWSQAFAAPAIVIGRNPQPAMGGNLEPVVMADARSFITQSKGVEAVRKDTRNAALKHILDVQSEIEAARKGLAAARPAAPGSFPKNLFGRDVAEAAGLLTGQAAAPIIKVALSGFDTHSRQRGVQDRLLQQLGDTLGALRDSLRSAGIWDHCLVMTYSEFGRRVPQNASQGTDHGKAAPHLVMGGAVRGGILGPAPDFSDLDNGDVRVSTDYRELYNAVLGRWWGLKQAQFEPERYPALPVV